MILLALVASAFMFAPLVGWAERRAAPFLAVIPLMLCGAFCLLWPGVAAGEALVEAHLFRDCAATDIALFIPEHVGITKSVLGHASPASSQKSYNQATSFTAVGRLDAVITGLRED